MARYAIHAGLPIAEWATATLARVEAGTGTDDPVALVRKLTRVHRHLSEVVAPATPASIRITLAAGSFSEAVKELPLLAGMLVLGAICSAMLLVAPQLGDFIIRVGIAGDDVAWMLADTALYVGAAGTGAAFYALFTMHSYVKKGTFEPKYTIVYWTRFFLGVMAGVVLVFTLDAWHYFDPAPADGAGFPINRALTALLGGYSADAVNRILSRMVDMMVALVRGDSRSRLEEVEQAQRAKLRAQGVKLALGHARDLMALRATLPGDTPVAVLELLDRRIASAMGDPEDAPSADEDPKDDAPTP